MRLQIKKNFLISLITIATIATACVESDKDLYDPNYRAKNPMEEVVAPEGFDWKLSSTIALIVNVDDAFNGQYFYVIEVFDENPILSAEANLLAKGVAKKGQTFTTQLSIPKTMPIIYVRQTSPNGQSSVRAFETSEGTINCNFETSTPATRSKMNTRASEETETPKTPEDGDTQIFPTSLPEKCAVFNQDQFEEGHSYKVTAQTTSINLQNKKNITLYLTNNITLLYEPYLSEGSKMLILPDKKVIVPHLTNNNQKNSFISIGKGASLAVQNDIVMGSNFKLYNLGSVSAVNLTCNSGTLFYNKGTTTILNGVNNGGDIVNAGELTAYDILLSNTSGLYNKDDGIVTIYHELRGINDGCKIQNEGKLTTPYIIVGGGSRILNDGKVTVTEETIIDGTTSHWINENEWTSKNMRIEGYNNFCFNKCKLLVSQLLDLAGSKLINEGEAYIKANTLYMQESLVELGAGSLFIVTEQASFGTNNRSEGFKGTGEKNNKALLKMTKAIAVYPYETDMIHYSGNMQILCKDHPTNDLGDGYRYTMARGAEWADEHTTSVTIPHSECNEGFQPINPPTTPTNPKFPIATEIRNNYTLLFEDQWPLYGDYDMNDIVMELRHIKYEFEEDNTIEEVSFTITLQAVGAGKTIAAAVMLNNIKSEEIEEVEYGDNTISPTSFNTMNSGVEANQTFAVIPLFDDAHQLMKRNKGSYINTQTDSKNNVNKGNLPEISIEIELMDKVKASDFNIDNLNFFIITDKDAERKEVHMAGQRPSDLASTLFFGNNDDDSLKKGYYISKENLAWGIIVPQQFKWPLEFHNIKEVYKEFTGWVTSGGTQNKKWWNSFNPNEVYKSK
ncbi:MAG: LruC domain-containing protein [Bacteroides sp.]